MRAGGARWARAGWGLLACALLACAPAGRRVPADGGEPPPSADEVLEEYRAAGRAAYARGSFLREQGDLQGALQAFVEAVRLYPTDPALRLALAETQVEAGRGDDARVFLEQALQRYPGSAGEHLLLARLRLAERDVGRSAAAVDTALVRDPDLVPALQFRARLRFGADRFTEAAADFARADSLRPDDPETLAGLGESALRAERWSAAEAVLGRLLAMQPERAAVRRGLAEALRRQGRAAEAERILLEPLAGDPHDLEALESAVQMQVRAGDLAAAERLLAAHAAALTPRLAMVRGRLLLHLGRLAAADSVLAPLEGTGGLPEIEMLRGDIALRQSRLEDAAAHFRRARRESPQACDPAASLALVAAQQARTAAADSQAATREADAALRDAEAAAGPDAFRCHLLLARTYGLLRRFPEAVRHLEILRQLAPDDADILFQLAAAQQESGNGDAALRSGRAAIAADAEHAPALNFVGYLLAERGEELTDAEALVRRALAHDPDNGSYVDSLGWVLFRRGEFAAAVRELERAVQLTEEGDAIVLEHLGDAYVQAGRLADADRAYGDALRKGAPSSVAAKRARLAVVRGRP